jgi:hypothetical protein
MKLKYSVLGFKDVSAVIFPNPVGTKKNCHGGSVLPELRTARRLRRARLAAYMAKRRMMFHVLHIALGLLGWALIAAIVWGIFAVLR